MPPLLVSLPPESSLLIRDLALPVELVEAGEAHEQVYYHEVVVDGVDLRGVAGPDEAGGRDGHLLVRADVLRRLRKVADVRDRDHPLEGRRPEENGKGACRVHKKGTHS